MPTFTIYTEGISNSFPFSASCFVQCFLFLFQILSTVGIPPSPRPHSWATWLLGDAVARGLYCCTAGGNCGQLSLPFSPSHSLSPTSPLSSPANQEAPHPVHSQCSAVY